MNKVFGSLSQAILSSILCIFATTLDSSTAYAHHSNAMYDNTRVVTISGTITRYDWANPHVYIYMSQTTTAGKIEWEVECDSPGILHRQGWVKDTLHLGDRITVTGYPRRDADKKSVFPTIITRANVTLYDTKQTLARLATAGPASKAVAHGLGG